MKTHTDTGFYQHEADMEPLLPTYGESALLGLACELLRVSGRLSGLLNPVTRNAVADLLRPMNSYYSNLIEGHRTNPYDIERALENDFAQDPRQKDLQLESVAHINVQRALELRLRSEPNLDLFSADWICWLHEEFYQHLPDRFRLLSDAKELPYEVVPGRFRPELVTVGRHVPPHHAALPALMDRFSRFYRKEIPDPPRSILAIAASHHRLAWIHPFTDGNGRVVRLFSHALLVRHQLDAGGLWSLSRGLARSVSDYTTWLAHADRRRDNDLDGRGRLSDKALYGFCAYFLETAIDQVSFMSSLLELESLEKRIGKYLLFAATGLRADRATYLLWEALRRGEFPRGEAARITNTSERTARDILKSLLAAGLLRSTTEKGPVRLGFPLAVLEYYFPRLYPEGFRREKTNQF